MTQAIPLLTQEEQALARQAEHSEHILLAVAIRYLHWSKARAELLDAIAKEPAQLALIKEQINEPGRPGMHLPMEKIIEGEEKGATDA